MPVVTAVEYGAPLDVRMPVREVTLTLRPLAGRRCRAGAAQAAEGEPRLVRGRGRGSVRVRRLGLGLAIGFRVR